MNQTLKEVLEFQKTYGAHIGEKIGDVNLLEWKLRIKLILEELFELSAALGVGHAGVFIATLSSELEKFREDYLKIDSEKGKNSAEILKEAADFQYVVSGTFISAGVHHLLDIAHTATHRSNMSKLCKDMETALASIDHYIKIGKLKNESDAIIEKKDNGFVLMRKSDRKVLKSNDYKPAIQDIENLIISHVPVSPEDEFESWFDAVNKKHIEDTKRIGIEGVLSGSSKNTFSSTGKEDISAHKLYPPDRVDIPDEESANSINRIVRIVEKGWKEHIPHDKTEEE